MINKWFKSFFIFLIIYIHSGQCRRSGHKIILTGGGGGGSAHGSHQSIVPIPYPIPIPFIQHHPIFIEKQVPIYISDQWTLPQNHFETYEAYGEQEEMQQMHQPSYNHWFGTYHDK